MKRIIPFILGVVLMVFAFLLFSFSFSVNALFGWIPSAGHVFNLLTNLSLLIGLGGFFLLVISVTRNTIVRLILMGISGVIVVFMMLQPQIFTDFMDGITNFFNNWRFP